MKTKKNQPEVRLVRKIINNPQRVIDEMLQGFVKTMEGSVMFTDNPRVIKYSKSPVRGKVGIVTGGGSGHKPAFIGYIGRNMVDAVAVGEIFSSPPATAFFDAFKSADSGEGVACLYGNYAGDNMNVKMAVEMANDAGIRVKTVVANDDVASAPREQIKKRRGVAGEVLMWKIAGAKASMGASLDEVIAVASKAIDQTRSMGVGLSSCIIPEVGHPNFDIEDGMMEVGVGHHGEPGIAVTELESAEAIARRITVNILSDMQLNNGDETVVMVSGLGSTPLMELYILYNNINSILSDAGIRIFMAYVGNYFTSLEMTGASVTIMKIDEEIKACIALEADSMGMRQFGLVY